MSRILKKKSKTFQKKNHNKIRSSTEKRSDIAERILFDRNHRDCILWSQSA